MKSEIDMKLLERSIENLVALNGYIKVNLERDDGSREGIWAVPVTEEDAKKARSEDFKYQDVSFKCRLCNEPILTWYGKSWGDEIVARNRGSVRPEALIEDNFKIDQLNKIYNS